MDPKFALPRKEVARFCGKWRIVELAVFGSVLREDFSPESDIDLLVTFAPDAGHTLFDLVHMQNELRDLLGRDVDLVEKTAIEQSRNHLRRKDILGTARVVYAG